MNSVPTKVGYRSPDRVKRILAIKLSSLGDLFHALPAVHALKAASGAAIDWVVQSEYAPLVRCFSDVDRVIEFPRRSFGTRGFGFLWSLWRQRYDLVVDLQGLLKSAIPARLARSWRVIGPSFHREGSRLLYNRVAGPRNKNRHAVDENLDVVRFLGWPEIEPVFPLAFPRQPPAGAWPKIALAPVSRWQTKNWPMDHFSKLAEQLLDNGASVFLVGGSSDSPVVGPLVERLRNREGFHDRCGKTDLVGLGSLLQEMDLAITVDSGPMHMAAALGVPVLAIFGPTDPSRTGPYGPRHRIVGVEHLPCRPCFSDTCSRGDHACMRNLFPSAVLEAAAAMLNPLRQEA